MSLFTHPIGRAVVVGSLFFVFGLAASALCQETATDLPMWFDVSSTTPPNIKLNTDLTFELQNEESVAVDPSNPNNMVAVWRDFRLGFRQVGWAYTHDGGNAWTEGGLVPATPYDRDSDPAICANSSGVFYAVILSYQSTSSPNGLWVPVSFDSGMTWPFSVPGVDHPPEDPTSLFEDKEMIVCDQTGGPTDGSIYISWTRFGDTNGIWCVTSLNGNSFLAEVPVSDRGSVQWPVPAVGGDGRVIVAWWSYARSAILYDISHDQGQTWGADRVLQNLTFFPSQINGGITTFGFPAMTSDMTGGPRHGALYCAFEDNAADGRLDMYFTRSLDSGLTWSGRRRINDDGVGNGIDQFHPWIAVNPDGVITVAFYDRRLDPANNLLFDLWVTHSFDGGVSWTPNQRVSEVSSSPFDALSAKSRAPIQPQPLDPNMPLMGPNAGLIGEYIGVTNSRLRATMVFTDTRNGHQDVYAANMPLRLFPPKLISPDSGWQSPNPMIPLVWDDWSDYDSAMTYILEYATDPTFATGVVRYEGLTGHTYPGDVLPPDVYYWRLRAVDPFGDSSALSPVRSLEVLLTCACDCHGDPVGCDGTIDVFDVVRAVDVSFREGDPIPDPNPLCPYMTTDATCDDETNIFDVVAIVAVAFRNENPATVICNPCP